MTAVIRLVFTGLCVGWVLQIGARAAEGERPRDPAAQRFPEEVSSCAECHRETHDEWKASTHRGSWTTSLVQDRLHRMKEDTESCAGCHAAHLEFGGRGGVSRKPRPGGRELGVSCRTCHCTADCVMLGPKDPRAPRDGSRPSSQFAGMKAETLCRTCHEATLKSFDARPAAMRDKSCVDCHMPIVTRIHDKEPQGSPDGTARPRRRHTFYGSHVPGFVAGALRVQVAPDGAVTVANEGAGHAIPFAPVKTLFIAMDALDASGHALGSERVEIRHKNPILPGKAWKGQSPMPRGTDSVRVVLTYRFADYQPAAEHVTITTVEQKIP